jgi:hypothetical protein
MEFSKARRAKISLETLKALTLFFLNLILTRGFVGLSLLFPSLNLKENLNLNDSLPPRVGTLSLSLSRSLSVLLGLFGFLIAFRIAFVSLVLLLCEEYYSPWQF